MLVKCTVNGVEVPLVGGVITEDITNYFSTVTIVTMGCLFGGDVVLTVDGRNIKLKITSFVKVGDVYHTTCCPQQAWVHMNSLCKPFMGKLSVKMLLQKLRYSSEILKDSSASYWYIPAMGLRSLIDNLNSYASGYGAPVFYMDIHGFIKCLDLKACFKSPIDIKGSIVQDTANADWVLNYPGAVDVNVMEYDMVHTENVKSTEFGAGAADCFEVTGKALARLKQKIKNEHMYHVYTSRVLTVECNHLSAAFIGQCVKVNSFGPLVVIGTSIGIPVAENQPAPVTLKLATPFL